MGRFVHSIQALAHSIQVLALAWGAPGILFVAFLDSSILSLPEIIAGNKELTIEPSARLTSHRPVVGPLIVFVKRCVLQPLTQWLYEYTMDNFRRQAQINAVMFAALQALAIENAKLRKRGPGAA